MHPLMPNRVLRAVLVGCGIGIAAACGGSPSSPTPTPTPSPPAPPAGCAFTVTEPPGPLTQAGGELAIGVTTTSGCAWSASSSAAFITVMGGTTASGPGTARFAVQSNDGTPRQGQISVAGRNLMVQQAGADVPACAFEVSPTERTMPAGGGSLDSTVTVTSGANCAWTAASQSAFLTISSPSSGTGSATVTIAAAVNTAGTRVGTVTIAGRTVTVLQEAATATSCAFTISPTQSSVAAAGGNVAVTISRTQGDQCPWIAQSQANFLTFAGASSGTNSGTVTIAVGPNGGGARSGTVIVAGQTVTISQSATTQPCVLTINPTQVRMRAGGGQTFSFVTKTQGDVCPWTVQSQSSFITVNGGSSGVNDGGVLFQIAPNTGPERQGTVLIAGHTFTVIQGPPNEGCSFEIAPNTWSAGPALSSMMAYVRQLTGDNCTYNAVSSAPFVTVEPASGLIAPVGYQPVMIWVTANTGAARTGTVTVGTSVLTVSQAAATPSTSAAVMSFTSDPGDLLAQGQSQTLTYTQAQFNVIVNQTEGTMTFGSPPQSNPSVRLTVMAPTGQPLTTGYYPIAQRFSATGVAGVDFSYGSRGCNTSTGRLLVHEIVYGAGNTLERFHARFETFCEGRSAGLRGTLSIDAAGPTTPPAIPAFPAPGTGTTFFSYQSEPGDVIGQGGAANYTLANATFTPSTSGSLVSINVGSIAVGAFNWNLLFGSASGALPAAGTYDPATDPPQTGGARIRVFGPGSCTGSTTTGKFTVIEAVYGPGGTIQRFHATFEVRCGGANAALRGEIRILADPWR